MVESPINLKLKEVEEVYGTYGILNLSNLFNKQIEFRLWLEETKKIKDISKEQFFYEEFIEKYNYCKLEHVKFYNLAKYEFIQKKKKMKKKRVSIKEKFKGGENDLYIFDDERSKEIERKLLKEHQIKLKLEELSNTIDEKRIKELKQSSYEKKLMLQCYRTGMDTAARQLNSKLYSKK